MGGEHLRPQEECGSIDAPESNTGADDAFQQGQRNLEEAVKDIRAVDSGSFVQILRDTFDAADKNQHIVTNAAKDESNHHSPENQVCTQPADILAAECFDDLVQQTIIIVEHILNPHGGQCYGADDIGHDKWRP